MRRSAGACRGLARRMQASASIALEVDLVKRAVDCTCGEHFEARTDAELYDALKRHAEDDHPDWSDADMKAYLVRSAYDNVPEGARS